MMGIFLLEQNSSEDDTAKGLFVIFTGTRCDDGERADTV